MVVPVIEGVVVRVPETVGVTVTVPDTLTLGDAVEDGLRVVEGDPESVELTEGLAEPVREEEVDGVSEELAVPVRLGDSERDVVAEPELVRLEVADPLTLEECVGVRDALAVFDSLEDDVDVLETVIEEEEDRVAATVRDWDADPEEVRLVVTDADTVLLRDPVEETVLETEDELVMVEVFV